MLVMDGGYHAKRSWSDANTYGTTSSPMLSQKQNPQHPYKPYSPTSPTNSARRLPPISTGVDETRAIRFKEPTSPRDSDGRQQRHSNLQPLSAERPEKRPRWQYGQGLENTRPEAIRAPEPPYHPSSLRPDQSSPLSAVPDTVVPGETQGRLDCYNCSNTDDIVRTIVLGLIDLQSQLRHAVMSTGDSHSLPAETEAEAPINSLRNSLQWAANSIQSCTLMFREVANPRSALPHLNPTAMNTERPSNAEISNALSISLVHQNRTALEQPERVPTSDQAQPHMQALPKERQSGPFDSRLPPMLPSDSMRKTIASEHQPSWPAQSPHRSSPSSAFGSAPSPMQSHHSARTLPSPSNLQFPTPVSALPGNFSPISNQSAQASHLQDLQHQISTKTLAVQTLQREHDQLIAAYSRSQKRCSTLDNKSQVSDREINSLTEEKIRLQQQVEALEVQVEESIKSRDEAHRQATAEGAQWRQIMSMSSQLQLQGAEQNRQFRADRECWDRDRQGLEQRILDLESGKITLVDSHQSSRSPTGQPPKDILTSASLDVLREEIVRLRRHCEQLESDLQGIGAETEQLDLALAKLASSGQRIKTRAQKRGLLEEQASDRDSSG